MNIDTATRVRDLGLRAIETLSEALEVASKDSDSATVERIKKGVGISIGTIDERLLSVIYELHPLLDHLKNQ